jgi:hypothetical protein
MNPLADTLADAPVDDTQNPAAAPLRPRRLFVAEPGWSVSVKTSSSREFCHTMAPGQDYYHRLLTGEVFVMRNEEHLCIACATRRGLLVNEPKRLAEIIIPVPDDGEGIPLDSKWADLETAPDVLPMRD